MNVLLNPNFWIGAYLGVGLMLVIVSFSQAREKAGLLWTIISAFIICFCWPLCLPLAFFARR